MEPHFIPPHGGYEKLYSYQKSLVVFETTAIFCRRFLKRGDRTIDQMIQAARSGKQNIVEGSMASGTSKEMEIKLVNVARASLEELLEDYKDYLRVHSQAIWHKDSKEAMFMRKRAGRKGFAFVDIKPLVETKPGHVVANMAICLIHQANYLLDHQIKQLERNFLTEGGLKERMSVARRRIRRY
jgi:four helix bundle suffix protein